MALLAAGEALLAAGVALLAAAEAMFAPELALLGSELALLAAALTLFFPSTLTCAFAIGRTLSLLHSEFVSEEQAEMFILPVD